MKLSLHQLHLYVNEDYRENFFKSLERKNINPQLVIDDLNNMEVKSNRINR